MTFYNCEKSIFSMFWARFRLSKSAAELRPRHRAKSEREKILNFRGLETKNFDFWRPGEVQGEKILNFRGPETENIDFWRSGERKY